ncbi:hypothetical protein ACRAWD_07005 [Caulobacter segnis]
MEPAPEGVPVSDLIDNAIAELGDWRGEILAHLRALIPWRPTPAWSRNGSGASRSGRTTA